MLPYYNLTYLDSTLKLSIKRDLKLDVNIPAQTALYRRRAVKDT